MINEQDNIERVSKTIKDIIASTERSIFIVIDGDSTLIPTDSTLFFFEHLGLNFNDLEFIFHQHGYSYQAFQKAATLYSKINFNDYSDACVHSANFVKIYPEFLVFISELKSIVEFILVTSGLALSWKNVIHKYSLNFFHFVGGNYFPIDNYIVDKRAKGIISKTLIESGKMVFAFGDSMIDFEMLANSTFPFIIVNENRNKDVTSSFNLIPNLKQVSFTDFAHQDLPLFTLNDVVNTIKRK